MYPPLPEVYENYVRANGAFEGFTEGEMPGYVQLWIPAEIPNNNSDLTVDEFAPGYLAFAGNGGGEVYAFDVSGAVFMLPMIGMDAKHAIRVADSFSEFATRFQRGIR